MEIFKEEDEIGKKEESREETPNKKSLITFAKLNKYFLIPFLCPIFCMLTNLSKVFIDESGVIIKDTLVDSTLFNIAYVTAGLFHFISYFNGNLNQKKEINIKYENNNTGIKYIYNGGFNNKFNTKKFILFIILLSLILIFSDLINYFVDDKNVFQARIYHLFFIPLFSKIILKEQIYKHQFFSLLLTAIGFLFFIIPVCLKLETDDLIPNILNFINGISYPLFVVLMKYISEKYYISPLKISLLLGIIIIIIFCFAFILYSLIKYHDLSYFSDCFDFSKPENKIIIIIFFILYFLFRTIFVILFLLALLHFSPTLIMVTDIISPLLLWIVISIKDGESITRALLNSLGYFIVLFSTLIYNEIIIFNFCDLNKNTKKFVNQRLYKELEQIKTDDDISLSDNEEEI